MNTDFQHNRSIAETNMRICAICKRPVVELKKASYLSAGAGLRLVVHDACVEALQEAANERQEQEEYSQAVKTFTSSVVSGIAKRIEDVYQS